MPSTADPLAPKYRRVLLKLSGESLGHGGKSGISLDETKAIAEQLKRVHARGVQLAVVVGGGNILRGAQFSGGDERIKPATADYMGMLATVMNGLALQDTLETLGVETRLQSAVRMETVAEPYIRRRAIRHLEKGRVVILAGGTGNPFVTTDTAAALRGTELEVEVVLKATKVDGVYDSDPERNAHAVRYDRLTYDQVIRDGLRVMDIGAFEMCKQARLPILVFDYKRENAIEKAIAGHSIGTVVGGGSGQ
ncbi:uridylate kinase : Uridylate kinase OS=Singulisphaera acidiphila (strain ATCC BAA-1392 / DSM 18658 / VKM B-2454 / MOB10) GN=pyrH PE=3 SV=1: AA_kinase [Gemmataceae bacterium]|nr:uridylate kinase : Uridylate kinase OS=Singulisphaera acidiphila (strain ATCC BAA-1392 / DSM 18658 / VKM B-2454 / MOB10) GN=pyrH PE=3 SV=1: AA_kinase [Gemmataceae bacterium]VTT98657.1 uridylate kinase : Uridylate kinase OS=Singulisphaera acidiphila (strain ATCC BAA-1392 / DSM 18658 / VKM B-2454 / MOB10) GN=pyrH PE=3 SV=1: AA_kinase [Gemmataceae bacterium]